MKTSKFFTKSVLCLALVASIISCNNDDKEPEEVLEEEFVTNVILTFTNKEDSSDVVILANNAPDGQEGAFTNTKQGSFTANATYSLNFQILNSVENPPEDVLAEDILKEADEHFFKYGIDGLNLTMTRDADDLGGADDSKIGLKTTWVAGAASTGDLQIILVHQPETADDSNELGVTTGGSEDFRITFKDLAIQ